MAKYKVLSDNCTLSDKGTTVNSADFPEVNFEALVEGGHVAIVSTKSEKEEN